MTYIYPSNPLSLKKRRRRRRRRKNKLKVETKETHKGKQVRKNRVVKCLSFTINRSVHLMLIESFIYFILILNEFLFIPFFSTHLKKMSVSGVCGVWKSFFFCAEIGNDQAPGGAVTSFFMFFPQFC